MIRVYMIHDSKAEAYVKVFFEANHECAKRAFSSGLNPAHAADYTLFCYGDWNEQEGEFEPLVSKEVVSNGIEVIPNYGEMMRDLMEKPDPDLKEKLSHGKE